MPKLNVPFEVNDDLTSERVTRYRETVTEALYHYLGSGNADQEESEMIDKMLNDWERPA